jgi:hypothetical protein
MKIHENPFPGPMAAMACLLQHRTELQELGIELIELVPFFASHQKKEKSTGKSMKPGWWFQTCFFHNIWDNPSH